MQARLIRTVNISLMRDLVKPLQSAHIERAAATCGAVLRLAGSAGQAPRPNTGGFLAAIGKRESRASARAAKAANPKIN